MFRGGRVESGRRVQGSGEKGEKGKEREIGRQQGGRRAVEGTVGALNPFKYNQYRGGGKGRCLPPSPVIWMIFTVHSYNP